ncbi:unnamed protein product, partial [Mesorhabditis belari]|uniref:non-specific serine/threonine protein kinase n=1 Tax=Mesorhabditis belari TaxID=2138241 RepID=A0AAF3EQW5_9BILA
MADKLTAEQIEEYKLAFALFDQDGSGKIVGSELSNLMTSVGQKPTEEELQVIFMMADLNNDKAIDFDEDEVVKCLRYETAAQRQKLLKEAEILECLNHYNILSHSRLSQDVIFRGHRMFGIFTEYCDGGTLASLISDTRVIYSINSCLQWYYQLFSALKYLNERQPSVVHQDLKPTNIFLTKPKYFLKIGDFGSVKEDDHTCNIDMFNGVTPRYLSPSFSDFGERTMATILPPLEISHKNDVYSAGVCILETMTRGVIELEVSKSEDGKGESGQFWRELFLRRPFNYLQFCRGIQQGKLLEFCVPSCTLQRFRRTIKKCLLFSRDQRPTAAQVIEEVEPELSEVVEFLRENGTYRDGIEPRPIIDETQQTLVKPLGIDGTSNLVPVYDYCNQSSDGSTISFHRLSSSDETDFSEFNICLLRKFLRGCHAKIVEPKKKFVGRLHPYNSTPRFNYFDAPRKKYVKRVVENYSTLADREKEDFLTKVPTLLEKRKQQKLVYVEPNTCAEEKEKLARLFQSTDIFDNFSAILLFDYLRFCEAIEGWSMKKLGFKENSVFPWSQRKPTDNFQSYFGYLKTHTYSPRLFLRDYLSMDTKKDWYLLAVNESKFISGDLTQVQRFDGAFLDTKREIFLVNKDKNEMRFVRDRAFDPYQFVQRADTEAAVNNEMVRFEVDRFVLLLTNKKSSSNLAILDNLPIPGYIFESRTPPRKLCSHEPSCEMAGFPQRDFFARQYDSVENGGLQFPYYKCTSELELAYMNAWLEVLEVLDEPLQAVFPFRFPSLSTPFKMSADPEFINREITRSFVFQKIPDRNGGFLTLLGHPKNYREYERVICLNFETKDVQTIAVSRLAEKLKEETLSYVIARACVNQFEFQYLDKNGVIETSER